MEPRIARLKERLLTAPYELCMARALHFTRSYRATEGRDPHLRNAFALKRTLQEQKISIYPDEQLAGSKTERFLAGPLSVERGDFLRSLQLEMDLLHLKQRPFLVSHEDTELFYREVLPYWDGRSLRDRKVREWKKSGLLDAGGGLLGAFRRWRNAARFVRYLGRRNGAKLLGANRQAPLTLRRLRALHALRYELAYNNPTPAVFCFDMQGHLSLGVDKVVTRGMGAIIEEALHRLARLQEEEPGNGQKRSFLKAVIISLEAAIRYAARFAALAEELAGRAASEEERERLRKLAVHCRHVPGNKPRTFHEALQAAWFTLLVGEIQYGTHEVFAVGRIDQYLYPYYKAELESGRLTRAEAIPLLQEFFIKQDSNVEPIPELGMETNGVLGNSQHVATIGGVTPDGRDAANELTFTILEAFEEMKGSLNQLSVRSSEQSPPELLRRAARIFRTANGIAFYNDKAVIAGLLADGMKPEDARDYCIVGCIETSGQSDTQGCPGGHELVLPVVLSLTLTRGKYPPPAPGQQRGFDSGDPKTFATFDAFLSAFTRQLEHQVGVLIEAAAGKDRAYREQLPAPYVSALMDDCIERACDVTAGGARYDFTSVDVRGLATLVDSLVAIRRFVYERSELSLPVFIEILAKDFIGHEALRQRILLEAPKYGVGDARADRMALEVLRWLYELASKKRNVRGGRFRVCYYSYGNHVIDGLMLGATPDGRRRGQPISNGVSPSNLVEARCGPAGPFRTVARFPPEQVSSGVALNMRFHPSMLKTDQGCETFASMIETYFRLGGMHVQPNVVSAGTLRDAQRRPERYRDLIVKVSGYSAYFTDLGKSIQEDIIARCEFGGAAHVSNG